LGELSELACIGLFAKVPNAAKYTQLGQITPNHANSRALFLMSFTTFLLLCLLHYCITL